MAKVTFFAKPGCISNGRQKALLAAVGHELEIRNLLTERWMRPTWQRFAWPRRRGCAGGGLRERLRDARSSPVFRIGRIEAMERARIDRACQQAASRRTAS